MSFLGLVPAESSTGETVRRKGLTLAGNRRARRVLVEAAWTYRYPARISETLRARLDGLPKTIRDIAWKGQVRLCARYRRLSAAGKKLPVVVAAIAREWPPSCGQSAARWRPRKTPRQPQLHSAGGGAAVGNSRRQSMARSSRPTPVL